MLYCKLCCEHRAVDKDSLAQYPYLREVRNYLTYEAARPTIVIGQDYWHLLVIEDMRRGTNNQQAASLTPLGWTVHGVEPAPAPLGTGCTKLLTRGHCD